MLLAQAEVALKAIPQDVSATWILAAVVVLVFGIAAATLRQMSVTNKSFTETLKHFREFAQTTIESNQATFAAGMQTVIEPVREVTAAMKALAKAFNHRDQQIKRIHEFVEAKTNGSGSDGSDRPPSSGD